MQLFNSHPGVPQFHMMVAKRPIRPYHAIPTNQTIPYKCALK